MTPATPADLQSFYLDEFMDMTKDLPRHNFAAVNADFKRVAAEEKAAKLPIDVVIGRMEALLDACDGDSSGILEDCLSKLREEEKFIDRIMADAEESYEVVALRQSEGARNL